MHLVSLPVEIESNSEQVGLRRTERRGGRGEWMNPVKHDSRTFIPVPIQARSEVVVLARADVVEIEVRPT